MESTDLNVTEKMRMELLKEEFKLRSSQPEAWTKTKYRKYANFGRTKREKEEENKAKQAKVEKAKA